MVVCLVLLNFYPPLFCFLFLTTAPDRPVAVSIGRTDVVVQGPHVVFSARYQHRLRHSRRAPGGPGLYPRGTPRVFYIYYIYIYIYIFTRMFYGVL